MHHILEKILFKKKADILLQKQQVSLRDLQRVALKIYTKSSFISAISQTRQLALIAELKFASPTNPNLGLKENILQRAVAYENAGANALSIITEQHFFKGDLNFVTQVKKEISLPILQKDFVIDAYQIYQAKVIGADALLLIARITKDAAQLAKFVSLATSLGIEPIVEIANEEDKRKARESGTKVIAINARNLDTFAVNVPYACTLLASVPPSYHRLGFSGIDSAEQVNMYKKAGANAVLIGTSLMQAENISDFITTLQL